MCDFCVVGIRFFYRGSTPTGFHFWGQHAVGLNLIDSHVVQVVSMVREIRMLMT